MHFDVLRTPAELDRLAGEWNDLLVKSAIHVPFLRHEYLSTWWGTLGGGEWDWGKLYVVTARQAEGTLVGIAPLFLTRNRDGEDALMLLGSIEISDYLDIIVRPEHVAVFLNGLLEELTSPRWPDWRTLDWYNLLENSPTLPALKSAAERMGWEYDQASLLPAPFVALPGDWEAYLSALDKKQRHEVRRKIRRAENYPEPVRWYMIDDEADLDEALESLLFMMSADGSKKEFLTGAMQLQLRSMVHAVHRTGWLQLSFLEVGGEKAAGYLNFDYDNRIWVYNSGINPRFRELSPGWVLLGYLLKWANERKRDTFDFMRGGEDYKYRLGGVSRMVVRAKVRR